MTELYVDTGHGSMPKVEATPAMLKALSGICMACGGKCCRRFQFPCRFDDEGHVDLKAMLALAHDKAEIRNINYACRHFIVEQRLSDTRAEYSCDSQAKDGHCTDYRHRPPLCRGYICGDAWFDGHPPRMHPKFMDMVVVSPAWEREVKPVVDKFWDGVNRPRLSMALGMPTWLEAVIAASRVCGSDGAWDYGSPEPVIFDEAWSEQ